MPVHGHLAEVEAVVIEKPRRRGHRRDRREYVEHNARRDNSGNQNESNTQLDNVKALT